MLFLEGQVLLLWNDKESTIRLSLYSVTKFWNDKHTLEEMILPSKVWHFNCFIMFASDNGIRAEIALVGNEVCSLCEAGSKWIQPFFSCCPEFIFDKTATNIVIGDVILIEASPYCDGWWMDFLMIQFANQTCEDKFVRTCIKWKQ
jgi:hypothetical protein